MTLVDRGTHLVLELEDECPEAELGSMYVGPPPGTYEVRERKRRVNAWWSRCAHGIGDARDLGCLPEWRWNRFGSTAWERRCDRQVVDAIRDWTPERGRLVILASTGSGKSSALSAWLHRLRTEAIDACEHHDPRIPEFLYTTAFDIAEAARRRKLGEMNHALFNRATTVPIFFLDELNRSAPGDIVAGILESRYARDLPTVVCSGMARPDLGALLGAAFVRKMSDGGRFLDLLSKESKCA